ncbi:MAG: phytanoyl-CoA dioxygenase family protein [Chromatiales bacterium]|nr:phytanoyl-CoA dioxygenase family protein [Chromatiales bacterium]
MPYIQIRRFVAGVTARGLRVLSDNGADRQAAPDEAANTWLKNLRTQGFTMIDPLLTPKQLDEVNAYLQASDLVAPNGQRFPTGHAPTGVNVASYSLATMLSCPHVWGLMNHPRMLAVAEAFLGCTPTISGARIDWYGAHEGGPCDVQQFHRDYDDWKFLKMFVYLTDVDDDTGPHEYIARSHLGSGRVRAIPYQPEEIAAEYGKDAFTRICGPRGTSFMADTWGIHKGNVPTRAARVMMQIQYSIFPVPVFNYDRVPLALPSGYSKRANRLLVSTC